MAGFEKSDQSGSGGFEFSAEESAYLDKLSLDLNKYICQQESEGDPFPRLFSRLMELGIDHSQKHLFSIPKGHDWDKLYARSVGLERKIKETGKMDKYTGLRLYLSQANTDESGDVIIETFDYLISFKYGTIGCQKSQVNKSDVYRQGKGRRLKPHEGILIENHSGKVRLVKGDDYDKEHKKLRLSAGNVEAACQLIEQLKPFTQTMRDELDQ